MKAIAVPTLQNQEELTEVSTLATMAKELTRREREILQLVLKEYQNKEIADELHLETSTIKTHLSKIYRKLHVENRSQLLANAELLQTEKTA
jgi:DNA-binding NarL/FixJ family response regulator